LCRYAEKGGDLGGLAGVKKLKMNGTGPGIKVERESKISAEKDERDTRPWGRQGEGTH